MILSGLDGLFWFTLALLGLTLLQRLFHAEIQLILFYLTRSQEATILLFSLIFLPGVLLHETSHYLMAKLLRVRTGRFSIWPHPLPNGQLRLGYVEIGRTDALRSTLIGLAPLLSGLMFLYVAAHTMNLSPLWAVLRDGKWELFWLGMRLLPTIPHFSTWFYLALVVSSTMTPSASDRHGWAASAILIGALGTLLLLGGSGPWLIQHMLQPLNEVLRSLALLLLLSLFFHVLAYLPTGLLRRFLERWIAG